MRQGIDVEGWRARGEEGGLIFNPGRVHAFDGAPRPWLRLGYASLSPAELREAVDRLQRSLEAPEPRRSRSRPYFGTACPAAQVKSPASEERMSSAKKVEAKKATVKKALAKKAAAPKKAAAKKAAPKKATPKKAVAKKAVAPAGELPTIAFAQPRAWAAWLEENHASSRGVWLKLAKKASGVASVTYAEAVEVALAWGWIDGQGQRFDESYWLQKFTPRGPKSLWSKINRDRALALIAAGEMRPPGLAEVERAQRDGRWDAAYDSPSRATVPDVLSAALAANPRAAAFFAALDATNRYAVLFRIHTAKKPETRARRVAQFVEMLAKHEKVHP